MMSLHQQDWPTDQKLYHTEIAQKLKKLLEIDDWRKESLKEVKEWEKSSLDQEKENITHWCKQKQQQLHQHTTCQKTARNIMFWDCQGISNTNTYSNGPWGSISLPIFKTNQHNALVITGNQSPLLKDSIASHDLKKMNKSALKMILLEEIWLND